MVNLYTHGKQTDNIIYHLMLNGTLQVIDPSICGRFNDPSPHCPFGRRSNRSIDSQSMHWDEVRGYMVEIHIKYGRNTLPFSMRDVVTTTRVWAVNLLNAIWRKLMAPIGSLCHRWSHHCSILDSHKAWKSLGTMSIVAEYFIAVVWYRIGSWSSDRGKLFDGAFSLCLSVMLFRPLHTPIRPGWWQSYKYMVNMDLGWWDARW